MPMTPSEQMLYSATRLTTFKDGIPLQYGTGFIYAASLASGQVALLMVTNKHVLEDCDRVDMTMHLGDGKSPPSPTGKFHSWQMEFTGAPILHPDPDVDLCAIAIGGLLENAKNAGISPFILNLNKSVIPSPEQWEGFDAMEQVVMVGCPNGLFDEVNNLPIFRRGSTASDLTKDFQGKNEFLVDLACFPGSSGSPVFLYDTTGFDRMTGKFTVGKPRNFLLGILYAGPTITEQGAIVLSRQATFEISSMMHLGQVIKSTALLEFDRLAQEQADSGKAAYLNL